MFHKELQDKKSFVIKSMRRLLVPFVIFSLVGYFLVTIPHLCSNGITLQWLWKPWMQILAQGRVTHNGPLWFLLTLFVIRMVYLYLPHNYIIVNILLGLLIGCIGYYFSIRPRYISNIATGSVFYGIGYLYSKCGKTWIKQKWYIPAIVYILSLIFPQQVDMLFNEVLMGTWWGWMVAAVSGCVVFELMFEYIIHKSKSRLHLFSYVGQNTMAILVLHWPIMVLVNCLCDMADLTVIWRLVANWFVICIWMPLAQWILTNRYLKWTIGN